MTVQAAILGGLSQAIQVEGACRAGGERVPQRERAELVLAYTAAVLVEVVGDLVPGDAGACYGRDRLQGPGGGAGCRGGRRGGRVAGGNRGGGGAAPAAGGIAPGRAGTGEAGQPLQQPPSHARRICGPGTGPGRGRVGGPLLGPHGGDDQ